jgi:HK97 family phage major capsid protein
MPTFNSMTTRTDAAALIPEAVSAGILQGLPAVSASLSQFRTVRMTRAQERMPVLSALPIAYWLNTDGADDTLKQTSEMAWGNKYLDVRELAVIIPIPEAVIDDSDFDIWDEIRPRLTEAFGNALDAATLMNVANPWPETYQKGIAVQAYNAGNYVLEGSSVAPHNDFAGDISDTMAKVEEDGFDVNTFWARRKIRARLRNLRDDNGNPIYQPIAQGNPATLYGETLSFVGSGPWVNNYELIAGDRNAAILGIRQDISFKIFTEGVISDASGNVVLNLMQQDSVAMRAVGRFAFAVANPVNAEGVAEATRFPFAVLVNSGS